MEFGSPFFLLISCIFLFLCSASEKPAADGSSAADPSGIDSGYVSSDPELRLFFLFFEGSTVNPWICLRWLAFVDEAGGFFLGNLM